MESHSPRLGTQNSKTKPSGQGGSLVGFLNPVAGSVPLFRNVPLVQKIGLPICSGDEFADLRPEIRASSTHKDDRKSAALATNRYAPVDNAADNE